LLCVLTSYFVLQIGKSKDSVKELVSA